MPEGLHLARQLHVVRNACRPETPTEAALHDFAREHRKEIAETIGICSPEAGGAS